MPGLGLGLGFGVGGGGAHLSPVQLLSDGATSVILQLDLDDPRNVVTGSGLSYVFNQATGATVHATQGTDADRPALGTGGLGGHRYATGDGTAAHLDLVGMTDASHEYTFFFVVTPDTVAGTQTLLGCAASESVSHAVSDNVAVHDGTASRVGMASLAAGQLLTVRVNTTTHVAEFWRDGVKLGSVTYDDTWSWSNPVLMAAAGGGASGWFDGALYYAVVVNRACTDAEVALINGWLMSRFGLTASLASIADLGAWWDLDHATYTTTLSAITDRALGQTINVVGSPAIVTVGGEDFVRFDGSDDVLWIADAAALDGAAGNTHVLKHANTEALPSVVDFCNKGRLSVHGNGGLCGNGSSGTRFVVRTQSITADAGPLAEFTSPAETIAVAIEHAAAVRRVDGDGTYSAVGSPGAVAVGDGSLSWGALDNGIGPTFTRYSRIDLRAAAYYARPLNEYELKAAHEILRDGP